MSAIKHYRELNVYEIENAYDRIIGQLVKMVDQPEKWLIHPHPES
jgi:hypothetical protein